MDQLEAQRSALEELDTVENAVVQRIRRNPALLEEDTGTRNNNKKKRPYKEMLLQQHEIKRFTQLYAHRAKLITRKEVPLMSLDEFDALLQAVKEDGTNAMAKPMEAQYALRGSKINVMSEVGADLTLRGMFSGEEFHGKCLDLVAFHEQWLQLSLEKLSYTQYLVIFDKFEQQQLNKNREYLEYLTLLVGYLRGFIARAKPLFALDEFMESLSNEYAEQDDNLYCQACEKTFAKKTVFDAHLNGKKHLKNAATSNTTTTRGTTKDFKLLEHLVTRLTKSLAKVRQNTRDNTLRRMALSERERAIEIEQLAQEEELSSSSSDEDQDDATSAKEDQIVNNNPHNLPLGADGHPIPFWLFKLYGLKIEYPCEICDFKYKGRKAFEKHFTDVRHAQRLKALGIEPSEVFRDISSVVEAQKLWNSLRKQRRLEEGDRENAVEVEDDEGNVMSEKVYNDLKKQGLL